VTIARWTPQEDAQLRRLLDAGLTYDNIAHRMVERSKHGIKCRARRLAR